MAARTCEELYLKHLTILCLPLEVLQKIFSYLTYDETSAVRMVSKMFDVLCRQRLNDGLNRVDRLHSQIHRELKGKLPRRESERRNHVLARHIDILSAIETRLSLLNMTYSKYIDMGLCCFIPGKVLDEMFHVLNEIRIVSNPPRAHELLQELRDISSMAMEHFDEKIVPLLKQETQACSRFTYSDAIASLTSVPRMHKSRQSTSNVMVLRLEKRLAGHVKLLRVQNRRFRDLEKKLVEQVNWNTELERHKTEQDRRIAELEQKIVDYDQKFVDMMVEIARVRGSCGGGDASVTQSTKDGKSLVEVGCDAKSGSNECTSDGVRTDEVQHSAVVAKRSRRKPTVEERLANCLKDGKSQVEVGCDAKSGSIECTSGGVHTDEVQHGAVVAKRCRRKPMVEERLANCSKDGKSQVEVGCDAKSGGIECASDNVHTDEVQHGAVVAKRSRRKPKVEERLANCSGDHDVAGYRSHKIGADTVHADVTAAGDAPIQQKTVVPKVVPSSQDISSVVAQADVKPIATKQRKRKLAASSVSTLVPVHPKRNRKVE